MHGIAIGVKSAVGTYLANDVILNVEGDKTSEGDKGKDYCSSITLSALPCYPAV